MSHVYFHYEVNSGLNTEQLPFGWRDSFIAEQKVLNLLVLSETELVDVSVAQRPTADPRVARVAIDGVDNEVSIDWLHAESAEHVRGVDELGAGVDVVGVELHRQNLKAAEHRGQLIEQCSDLWIQIVGDLAAAPNIT